MSQESRKHSREVFEKVRVNAMFFLVCRDFGWVFGPLQKDMARYRGPIGGYLALGRSGDTRAGGWVSLRGQSGGWRAGAMRVPAGRVVRKFEKVVPATPQSEVLAKFFEEIGEKCGELLAKFFADFRPSISRENGRKKIHEKSSTFSTVHQIKFFHCCNSGGLGAQEKAVPDNKIWKTASHGSVSSISRSGPLLWTHIFAAGFCLSL